MPKVYGDAATYTDYEDYEDRIHSSLENAFEGIFNEYDVTVCEHYIIPWVLYCEVWAYSDDPKHNYIYAHAEGTQEREMFAEIADELALKLRHADALS